ncbi:aminopeptidase N [Altererythrobacter sp. GH1-8]|uniref:aminopeptidase N n=1 Tax=Altererythrobacter sp. GH1-8 TaxID=3349333 RepID=UPI00374CFB91
MDIATTATTPEGNPELADAAPNPHDHPVIRREDYAPYPWLVPETRLEFDLGLDATRVVSKLTVLRNARAPEADSIRLEGDGLELLSVKVDGEPANNWSIDDGDLILPLSADAHEIEIATEIDPSANTKLEGLYASNGMLCTQCEAEGFRRITFFPDRPDVLSTYSVRMSGPKDQFPILLCNGNMVAGGEGDDGTHWAEWHDPWPKPSYLFALVAGDLVANSSTFTTMSGREVVLNVWVRKEDLSRTDHALRSLETSMKWDEEVFGREYDLDLYNIVAVSDFNMGAMENKGLNIFNTKYVLADPETATDADFDAIEGVIAHEYFHNWSGNRITCRDWFQLSLKEGFTVLRDQLFSQDMRGEAVKRIEDVRILRLAQFPEDAGPLAHPIRPDSYREINNFYTATVYNKGAEVIRMMRVMAGTDAFRKGTDLYFQRHDGEAATCEDFIKAIEDGAGLDLKQFRLWYSQAGTPRIAARLAHDGDTATITLKQTVPPTPGQPDKQAMPIPLKIALLDPATGTHSGEQLIVLDRPEQSFTFSGHSARPVLSINRGFTAPVVIERDASGEDLMLLARHDDDPFARYEAMQELSVSHLVAASAGALADSARTAGEEGLSQAFAAILDDEALDDAMRGELLLLPTDTYLFEQMANAHGRADPGAIHAEREGLKALLAKRLADKLRAHYDRCTRVAFDYENGRGARKMKSICLNLLASSDPEEAAALAARQYKSADNMTDRQGALGVLAGLDTPERTHALLDFYNRFNDNALVIDKWFTIQALSLHPHVVEHIKALAEHPDFNIKNPNRARSLYMAFAGNPGAFHIADGEGYRMLADFILALDPINPQTAARFVTPLGKWKRIEETRSALMKSELERIAKAKLSRDTFEQVSRSLEA